MKDILKSGTLAILLLGSLLLSASMTNEDDAGKVELSEKEIALKKKEITDKPS